MMTILIVDDAPFMREILHQSLIKERQWRVVGHACDGQEAIEKALSLQPDLILLDLVLPKKTGLEVAQFVHDKLPKTQILAMSTLSESETILKALEAGCVNYLIKPFEEAQLHKVIQRASENIIKKQDIKIKDAI